MKQNNGFNWDGWNFLHLNEIEIYGANGENLALNGNCFSYDIGWGGDPNCLNDGLIGPNDETCTSHSSSTGSEVYDYCVLEEAAEIERIKVYPSVSNLREILIFGSLLIFFLPYNELPSKLVSWRSIHHQIHGIQTV